MNGDVSRRRFLVCNGAAAAAAVSGCVTVEQSESERVERTYDGLAELSVSNAAGDLALRGDDRSAVQVRGEKLASGEDDLDTISLEESRDGDAVDLSVEKEDNPLLFRLGPDPELDLDVTVPDFLRAVDVETTNNDLEIRDVRTPVSASTTNGRLTVAGAPSVRHLSARNGAAEIDLDALDRSATVEVTNGAVSLTLSRSIDATVVARATNGDVDVEGASDLVESRSDPIRATFGDGTHRLDVSVRNGGAEIVAED